MAIISIPQQPDTNEIKAAYRPIVFLVKADAAPIGAFTDPCPVVYCDVYFNGIYYASISSTVYTGDSPFFYQFDIQDKAQEFLRATELTRQFISALPYGICTCFVRFRYSGINADGFLEVSDTAPVQATFTTAPVNGTGYDSNTFRIVNASLRHEDNPDLRSHLSAYSPIAQVQGFNLSRRPNMAGAFKVGGGVYKVSAYDFAPITFLAIDEYPRWLRVSGVYKNGNTFSRSKNITVSPVVDRVWNIDGGIPQMTIEFPTVQWNNVVEYDVTVYADTTALNQLAYQRFIVDGCKDRLRIIFLNGLSGFDGINLNDVSAVVKSTSGIWQKPIQPGDSRKNIAGLSRAQVLQSDSIQGICNDFQEQDMEWIAELFGSPLAYTQWDGGQGQAANLLPVVIEDGDFERRKVENRYEYLVTVKFRMANERINLRT